MNDCIFCKLASGEIDSAKIWEDKEFFAMLDNNPNTPGMTLVVTKKHFPSYAFDMPEDVYSRFTKAARKVAKLLDKKLPVQRTVMVMEGMGINHAHIKLYPLHGLSEKFTEMWGKDRTFFEKYPGYISTQLGPQAKLEDLKRLANKIKS
jgi:diadenosine tetraphosphate (Ap4A) HIT family hydrolase